jgi:hypothetical protein
MLPYLIVNLNILIRSIAVRRTKCGFAQIEEVTADLSFSGMIFE